jgi:two-component system phosphate regulon response regulator PhoB
MTAKTDEIDRIVGFELGADDYVTKPFSLRELALRCRAVLRRHAPTSTPSGRQHGRLRIDRDGHRVWVDDDVVPLTPIEFRLLTILVDRSGRVQTRDALLSAVWEARLALTTRTVDTHVQRLRDKLGEAGDCVRTVRGVGYVFTADPSAHEEEP